MTHDEMIAVIQAHKEGKVIEWRDKEHPEDLWNAPGNPCWDFSTFDYRIKPELKYRPWKTVDEVPLGGIVYSKEHGDRYMIHAAEKDQGTTMVCVGVEWVDAEDLFKHYRMPLGNPCGVQE